MTPENISNVEKIQYWAENKQKKFQNKGRFVLNLFVLSEKCFLFSQKKLIIKVPLLPQQWHRGSLTLLVWLKPMWATETKVMTVFMRAGRRNRVRKMRRDNVSHLRNEELEQNCWRVDRTSSAETQWISP